MRADMMTMTLPRASAITCRKTPGVWVVNYLMGRDLDEQHHPPAFKIFNHICENLPLMFMLAAS